MTVVLILGRFADGHLCEGVVWEFNSIDLWHGWAPSLFARERHWTPEEQPGWRISRWLDPESLANKIDMIEHSGSTVQSPFGLVGP